MYQGTTTTNGELLENINYSQLVPLTFEEKVRMYMRCTKLELARMLAERDRIGLDNPPQIIPAPYPVYPNPTPNWPPPVWYQNTPICDNPNDGYGYSTSTTADWMEYPDEGYQEPPKFDAYDASELKDYCLDSPDIKL